MKLGQLSCKINSGEFTTPPSGRPGVDLYAGRVAGRERDNANSDVGGKF